MTFTPERIEAISEGVRRKWAEDEDYRRRNTESHRGLTLTGEVAAGAYINPGGYRCLTMQYDHPLASRGAALLEHRKVLYDAIGAGPHECHWNWFSRCRETALEWDGGELQVDHLDGDKLNNDPGNLVPSCLPCNRRGIRTVVARGGIYHNNTSGVTGASWEARTKKWKARAPGGVWLGRFSTLEAAAAAIEEARR